MQHEEGRQPVAGLAPAATGATGDVAQVVVEVWKDSRHAGTRDRSVDFVEYPGGVGDMGFGQGPCRFHVAVADGFGE